jgi:hypothetical protein
LSARILVSGLLKLIDFPKNGRKFLLSIASVVDSVCPGL